MNCTHVKHLGGLYNVQLLNRSFDLTYSKDFPNPLIFKFYLAINSCLAISLSNPCNFVKTIPSDTEICDLISSESVSFMPFSYSVKD